MDSASQKKSYLYDKLVNEMNHLDRKDHLSLGLRNELEKFPHDARKEIVNIVKQGCSPLFGACKKGQLEIAEYLIRTCGADIEQKRTCPYAVLIDGPNHVVTPLSCAAIDGNLSIVKLLIQSGADINAASNRGFTPIMLACSVNNVQVVKDLVYYGADINIQAYKGETCLMRSIHSEELCHFLLKNGADVNAKDIRNETVLHYAIKRSNSLKIVKLLLEYDADYTIKCRDGDDALQIACLKTPTEIFEYLISNISYSPERMANAHELKGTTYMYELGDITVGLNLWKQALMIRDKNGLYPKQPVMSLHEKYWKQREFETLDELMAMSGDLDKLKIQSLLISERILGTHHEDTVERLMVIGGFFASTAMRHERCIAILRCALQVRIEKDTVLHMNTCYTAQALVRTMLEFHTESVEKTIDNTEQRFNDIVEIYKLLCENIVEMRPNLFIRPQYKERLEVFGKIFGCITHLIYLITETAKTKSNKELVTNLLKRVIGSNIKCFLTANSILHLSISRLNTVRADYLFNTEPIEIFPNVNVLKQLLECGATLHVKNENGSTPLHIALMPDNYSPQVVKLLLDFGAHLDAPDADGYTPYEAIKMYDYDFPAISLINYTSLKCLSARQIVKNKISYVGQLPKALESFVRLHDATKPN